jgi:hypothetical protein
VFLAYLFIIYLLKIDVLKRINLADGIMIIMTEIVHPIMIQTVFVVVGGAAVAAVALPAVGKLINKN